MSQEREITEDFNLRGVLKTAAHSTVFEAVEPETERTVALKLLSIVGPHGAHADRERFQRALGVVQFLKVPGVPTVLDYGFTPDGSAFMVMEHEKGALIGDLLGSPPDRLVTLLAEAAAGLEALAEGGVYHHNLTPENLQVVERSGTEHVLLLGLGTAAFLTELGVGLALPRPEGHERFLAPELLDPGTDAGGCDWSADLYSLAAVACELLGATIDEQGSGPPEIVLPEEVETSLVDAEALRAVLASALHQDPEQREPGLSEMVVALKASIGVASAESGRGRSKRTRKKTAKKAKRAAASRSEAAEKEVAPPDLPAAGTTLIPPPLVDGAVEAADSAAERSTTVLPPTLPLGKAKADLTDPEDAEVAADEISTPDEGTEGDSGFDPNRTNPNLVVDVDGALAAEGVAPPPPGPPSPPPLAQSAGPGEAAKPPKLTAAPPGKPTGGRRWIAIAAGVIVVCAVTVAAFLWLRRAPEEPAEPVPIVAEQPTPVAVPQPTVAPVATPHPALEQAQVLLTAEDVAGARAALESISAEDLEVLSAEEASLYETLLAQLAGDDIEQATEDLRGGLEIGSAKMLQRALAVLDKLGEDELDPGLAEQMERARQAMRAHTLLWRAHRAEDHQQVLERAAAMIEILPGYSRSYEFREESALVIEARADEAEKGGSFDQAVAELELIAVHWPDRPGLRARIDRCRQQKAAIQRQEGVLAEALATIDGGDPVAGLALLSSVTPEARFADRFADARARLLARLAELDAEAPVVALAQGAVMQFKKDEGVTIPFRISDDYGVANVKAMVRTSSSGDSFRPVAMQHQDGERWVLEITAEMHGNKKVQLYVEAADRSGNTGRLGTPEAPLQVKKKSWFSR